MKIRLNNGTGASQDTISELESSLGFAISKAIKQFLRAHNGAEPEGNCFKVGDKNASGVNEFIPTDQILQERSRIENIPKKAYPIAWAEGGNFVIVDEGHKGAVYYWDHELPKDLVKIAPDFNAFLDLLNPFDIKSVTLKPGQVRSVWVDPEFRKKLDDGESV